MTVDLGAPLAPVEGVLAAAREHGGLPSLGHTLTRLTRLLESEDDGLQALADVILSDVSLTHRLLRLANTVPFRSGRQAVTTVTRAIVLLGFDHVRAAATNLVLLEGLLGRDKQRLRSEFHQSLLAGSLARELLPGSEGEEAGIAAMFRNVGRLLTAVFGPAHYASVLELVQHERLTEPAAARRVLGCSFDDLSERVLQDWQLPERLLHAVQPLPLRLESPRTATERVRVAAQFAEALAAVVSDPQPERSSLDEVLERFAGAYALERDKIVLLLERAGQRTREFELAFGLVPSDTPLEGLRAALPTEAELDAVPVEVSAQRDAVGRPANAREVLLAGLAEATECLARGGSDLNTVTRVVLEAMYSGMGYARTALVLRERVSGIYRTRGGFGEPKTQFSFNPQGGANLFAAALTHGKDLHIADTKAERIGGSLPEWYRRDFAHSRSFVIMPIVINGRALGFFYSDRWCVDEQGLTSEELNLMRALRSQVILAMRAG
jgi:HD-like signal output (HDOD) protein